MTNYKDLSFQKNNQEFEELSNLTLGQLQILTKIYENFDGTISSELVENLRANEEKIDNLELKLDEHIIKTIVLYKPMASDLRGLISMYRMVINLERIGDLAIKIMKMTKAHKDSEILLKMSPTILEMITIVSKMLTQAILSFTNSDPSAAKWTIEKDEIIDDLNQKLIRKSIKKEELNGDFNKILISVTDIRTLISAIERIGDHATHIAEASLYALSGKNIRHQQI